MGVLLINRALKINPTVFYFENVGLRQYYYRSELDLLVAFKAGSVERGLATV